MMKPLTWLSARSRAQITVRSHQVELPIHFFWPLSTQMSPSRLAVVVRPPPVPEPTSVSVNPNAPIFSSRAIVGIHFFRLSSHPPTEIAPYSSPLLTPYHGAQAVSTRSLFIL